jgi:hypothetical protein
MMEPFESSGVWWLPNDPSGRVAGTLRYSQQDGLALDLLGVLGGAAGPETKTHDIILGTVVRSSEGQFVTLKDCRQDSFTATSSGLNTESYHVERALLGQHLSRPDEFLFSRCVVMTSGLNAWAAHLRGWQLELGDEAGEPGWTVRVTYTPPPALSAAIPGGTLSLSPWAYWSGGPREWHLREEVGFVITTVPPMQADDWNLRYVYPLLNLMTLVTDSPSALTEFRLSGAGRPDRSVKVVGHRILSAPVKDSAAALLGILVPLQDVQAKFPILIARWLAISEQYRDACNVFFALRYAPGAYLDIRLLNTSQALELYDARRPGRERASPAIMPDEIMALVPEGAREAIARWAKGVMIDLFPDALRRLATEHEATLAPLAAGNLSHLVNEILKFRNYVMFRGELPGDPKHYPMGLYMVTETLATLMKSCFLAELGFTPEERAAFFQRNAMYDFLRTGWASELNGI